MGTSLTGKQIKNTYKSLIKVSDNTEASASAKQLSDGNGNDFGVYIDTDGVFGIGSAPSYSLDVSSRTDGVALPVGTTANRPTGFNGLIRYNSTIGKVEFYDTGWKTIFTTSGGTISGSVTITGDLTVQGDNTIIEAQTVEVEDNILNLNRTQGSPDTATATTSGISIYRGDGVTEASFIFDDFDDTWDLTNNLVIAGTLQSSSYTDGTATLTGGVLSNAVLANGVTATTQANSDNSTKIATTAYVKSVVTLEDLDFAGGTGTGSVDLDSQTFTIAGTANEIETSASGQTLTIGLPDNVVITGDLTVDTNTLYVDATNNRVGIGTVSPSANLDIKGSSTSATIQINGSSGSNNRIYGDNVGNLIYQADTENNGANSSHRWHIDGSEKMRIYSGGDISFRDGSANEAFYWDASTARLGINSGSSLSNVVEIRDTSPVLDVRATGTSGSAKLQLVGLGSDGSTAAITSIEAVATGVASSDLAFTTRSSAGVISEKVRIDSSGNVGIGTTSPARIFTVSRDNTSSISASFVSANNQSAITLSGSATTSDTQVRLAAEGNDMLMYAGNSERVRIDSSGNVGINETDPNGYWGQAKQLVLSGSNNGLTIKSAAAGNGRIAFTDTKSTTAGLNDGGLITYNHPNDYMAFQTNGTERMRILSSGGITFNGDTAAANALDDYEEGTFTPVVADAASGGNTATGGFSASYTKVGNIVHCDIVLANIDTTGLTSTNNLYMRNLPYTSKNDGLTSIGSNKTDSITYTGELTPNINPNQSYIYFVQSSSGAGDAALKVSAVSSGSADIWISITYRAA